MVQGIFFFQKLFAELYCQKTRYKESDYFLQLKYFIMISFRYNVCLDVTIV